MNTKKLIGYTTGVFDLFHVGHLKVLENAKSQCDYLIVGVTTDELCWEVKKKQTIIPFEDRIQIVEGIKWVDKVVPQSTMDKFEAWNRYRFSKMFVGDDWKGSDKWNQLEKEFNLIGVDIIYFPYTQHVSTSKLRQRLKYENES